MPKLPVLALASFLSLGISSAQAGYALIDLNAAGAASVAGEVQTRSVAKSVEVSSKQEGKFLALVPIKFTVRVTVHADGRVEVKYPWYSIFTVDREKEVETEIRVAVDNAIRGRAVGSVRAAGEPENPVFTEEESADIEEEIQEVLKKNLSE
jgi:hypothetical protein